MSHSSPPDTVTCILSPSPYESSVSSSLVFEPFYCQSSVRTSKKSAVSRTSLSTASLLWRQARRNPQCQGQDLSTAKYIFEPYLRHIPTVMTMMIEEETAMYGILRLLSSPIMIREEQRGRNVLHTGPFVVANNDRKGAERPQCTAYWASCRRQK